MPHPTIIRSGLDFRDLLQSRSIVFAMFYASGTASKAMMPVFDSLCEKHQAPPRVAFIKVKKDELSGLCREQNVEMKTTLTFATFVGGNMIDSTDGTDCRDLENMINLHTSRKRQDNLPKDHDRPHPHRRDRARSLSPRHRPRPRSQDHHESGLLIVNLPKPDVPMYEYWPAQMERISRFGPFAIHQSVHPVYRGSDGRYRQADVELSNNADGVEATYMDRSGPLDVERTIYQYPRPRGRD